MVFSSAIFLWAFLPLVFIINYFLKNKYSNIFLLLVSLFFYAWGEPYLVMLMMVSIFINWAIGKGIAQYKKYKKGILAAGILVDLAILGYFKYADFFVNIINSIVGKDIFIEPGVKLPIGISFFTFQAISYIVDVYRGETEVQDRLVNVALYISFFPQLIAGPIVKYKDINKQLDCRTITGDKIAEGFRRFIYGLSKKVLISNILGASADAVFNRNIDTISGTMAWIAALLYAFQIYYDFSGYSDMAIGLGKMFGFDFLENFNYPYLSKSVHEFWRRWHISLSTWFKEYVYIPLGGNRKGITCTYFNLSVVFFLTGLWHGASFNFVLWGLFHGFFSIVERVGIGKVLEKSKLLSYVYMFLVINFGWVLFRIEDLREALRFIKRMIVPWKYMNLEIPVWQYIDYRTIFTFVCAVLGMGILQKVIPEDKKEKWRFSIMEFLFCAVCLILCIASVASDTYNPFIYFKF